MFDSPRVVRNSSTTRVFRSTAACRGGVVVLGCLLLLSTGCAGMKESMQESMDGLEGAPGKLDGSVESTALLLVDAKLVGKNLLGPTKYTTTDVWIVELAEGGKPIHGSVWSTGILSSSKAAVFHELHPGKFRIHKIKSNVGQGTAELAVPPGAEFIFELEAGEARYWGRCTFSDTKRIGSGLAWEMDTDPELEIEEWKSLKKKYGGSDWVPVIEAEIREAKSRMTSEAS